jgi:hypothetical protein
LATISTAKDRHRIEKKMDNNNYNGSGRTRSLIGRGGLVRNSGGRNSGYGLAAGEVNERGISRGERSLLPQDCATSNYSRLIHDKSTWKFLQDMYYKTVDNSNDYPMKKRLSRPSGFTVDIVVKDDGYRGRSVYADEYIKKGTKIWNALHLVYFKTPKQLKSFLFSLSTRLITDNNVNVNLVHDLQCDILLWSYVEKGEGYVSLALDDGSFVNHGETIDDINLDKDCYALRDIQIGEELLENYTEFVSFMLIVCLLVL